MCITVVFFLNLKLCKLLSKLQCFPLTETLRTNKAIFFHKIALNVAYQLNKVKQWEGQENQNLLTKPVESA